MSNSMLFKGHDAMVEIQRDASARWSDVYGTCTACRRPLANSPGPMFGFSDNEIEELPRESASVWLYDSIVNALESHPCNCKGRR